MPDETLGEGIQRQMREAGATGCLNYGQHQRLKAVDSRDDLVAFLLAEGMLTGQYGKRPSPAAVRRAVGRLTSGVKNDQGQVWLSWLFS